VRKAQGDFIAAKFLPTGWKINDPSKIQLADTDRLLELWCQRQKDHVRQTFEFKGWEGDDKTMREPAEATSRKGCDTRHKDPVKKYTGKHTRRVKQESSSEDEEKDDDKEKKDDKEKEDDKEKDDDDDDGTSPPPKSKPVKNRLPVKKSRPVNARSTSPATSAAEHKDPRPPVK
jgi:phosphopantothenoylcysteine synthetase/decarboxylase